MGVDLTLLPVERETDDGTLICTVAMDLDLSRVIELFHDLNQHKITSRVIAPLAEIPEEICAQLTDKEKYHYPGGPWGNTYFGPISEDAYGNKLVFVSAGDIKRIFVAKQEVLINLNHTELAAIRYISALHDKTKVILYFW